MKRFLFALAFLALPALAHAQTISATARWTPNPATDNIVQYTVQLDTATPVVVLPAACTATVCSQVVPAITVGKHTLTLIAQNATITGGTTLQSSAPSVLTFSINTVPVTVLGVQVTIP